MSCTGGPGAFRCGDLVLALQSDTGDGGRRVERICEGMNKYALSPLFKDHKQLLLDYIPHAEELGMKVESCEPHEVVITAPYRPELVGDPSRGIVFGGVVTTLLDQACGLCVMCSLAEIRAIATLDLRIDYTMPATPGLAMRAYAHCYKVTSNIAFVRGSAYHVDPDAPFATCSSSFMLAAHEKGSTIESILNTFDTPAAVAEKKS